LPFDLASVVAVCRHSERNEESHPVNAPHLDPTRGVLSRSVSPNFTQKNIRPTTFQTSTL
jgi:hypothetical protein